jgi:antiviral helicase SLH1
VLDQSIRIIQASIDVLTELGYFSSCEMMISLLQAIKSARWPTDGPLSIFPGVEMEKEKKRLEHPNASPKTLIETTATSPAALERAARFAGVPNTSLKRFIEPVSRLPILQLDLGNVNALGLDFRITRQNPARMQHGGIRIFAPRYPKPQTEGFFAIVSYSSTDEIIALKRVGWHDPTKNGGHGRVGRGGRGGHAGGGAHSKSQSSAKVSLPPEAQGKKVDITVHSDCYPGMKWRIEGVEIPEAPVVDASGKGKDKA